MGRRSDSCEGWGWESEGEEGDEEGREWDGLEGRKKEAEGRMPPAWVAVWDGGDVAGR